jgi:quinol monooxygenase YgiN
MSVIIVATIVPKPEFRDDVIAALEKAAGSVYGEAGCELYALHTAADGPLVMIEKYADQDAVKAHSKGVGVKGLMADIDGKLESPMGVQFLTPRPAGTSDKGVL